MTRTSFINFDNFFEGFWARFSNKCSLICQKLTDICFSFCMEHKVNRIYSNSERRTDALVHYVGITLVAVAVPLLIYLSAQWQVGRQTFFATAVYGFCFAAMIGCSALYHMTAHPTRRLIFQRLDHTAIYLKIAGTYTPFAVIAGPPATWLLFGIWTVAFIGIFLKQFSIERFRTICLTLYIAMGWAVVVVGQPLIEEMNTASFILLIIGGLIYSTGVFFYLWKSLRYHNTIWHIHVLSASLVLYASVLIEIHAEANPQILF